MIKHMIFILASAFAFSCTDDGKLKDDSGFQSSELVDGKEMREMIVCDLDFVASYPGTACCTYGPAEARPGETLEYSYANNRNNTTFTWTVVSGSITIVSGQGTATATMKFGNDFEGGEIRALGSGVLRCSEGIQIKKLD